MNLKDFGDSDMGSACGVAIVIVAVGFVILAVGLLARAGVIIEAIKGDQAPPPQVAPAVPGGEEQ